MIQSQEMKQSKCKNLNGRTDFGRKGSRDLHFANTRLSGSKTRSEISHVRMSIRRNAISVLCGRMDGSCRSSKKRNYGEATQQSEHLPFSAVSDQNTRVFSALISNHPACGFATKTAAGSLGLNWRVSSSHFFRNICWSTGLERVG